VLGSALTRDPHLFESVLLQPERIRTADAGHTPLTHPASSPRPLSSRSHPEGFSASFQDCSVSC